MISISGLDYIKKLCETQADIIPGGVVYVMTNKDSITWRKGSSTFDLDMFYVSDKIKPDSVAGKAMKQGKTIIENVERSLYGIRLKIIAEPVVDGEGLIVGALSTIFPVLHPVAKAFDDFAPILSEMFSHGVILYITDLHKFISLQNSRKFKITQYKSGDIFNEDATPSKVIKDKKPISVEYDASVYGVPTLGVCYPMVSDTGELVGTFGMLIPKVAAANLREMSQSLEDSLTEIASTIEELAVSASNIHVNEQELNNGISEITSLSNQIDEISSFIKEIADKTKMLGLNAAIEAARAGEAGRGFGVVANEIRNLSEQSKSTVPKIKELTDGIIVKVNESSIKSQSSLASSQEQAAATEQITASIEAIISISEKLNKIALEL